MFGRLSLFPPILEPGHPDLQTETLSKEISILLLGNSIVSLRQFKISYRWSHGEGGQKSST